MHVGSARLSHWNSVSSCTINVIWVILLTRVHCLILIDNNQENHQEALVLPKSTM
ncbi:hypothetical protein HanIR_Chr14g0701321 [Helianthus annuus]|nr:hypothetical protein HanIR_Chr14g0701321 [Helianthus annuus]